MPRVLFVHHRPQPSGAARSLALLIDALGEEWEAHVLVPGGGAARLFEEAGATVHRAPVPAFTHTWDVQYHGLRWLVAAREAAWVPAHARALRRVLHETRPTIVHLNDAVMLATSAVASRAGYPVVWHLRSSLAAGGADRRSRRITRWIDSHGAAAVAIDRDVAAAYPLRLPIAVVPNPVTVTVGDPADLGVPAGRLAVGYFGYLRRQKGWPQFLEALRLLTDEGVEVQGVIVGGGVRPPSAFRGPRGHFLKMLGVPDEGRDLEAMIRDLRLDDRVTRVPFLDDVGPVMRALDVVVFPNQGVGLGRPVLEASAYGVPVVASGSADGGGVLEPGVTGLLLPEGTPRALADALAQLAREPQLRARLGAAASRSVRDTSDPRRVAEQIQAIWTSSAC